MIIEEIDWRSPLDAFAPLEGAPYAHLLHAGRRAEGAEWSFIAAFPAAIFEAHGHQVSLNGEPAGADTFAALENILRQRRERAPIWPDSAGAGEAPPFLSGLIGYVGYEAGALLEPSAAGPRSPYPLPDISFGAYDGVAIFNHHNARAFIAAKDQNNVDRLADTLGTNAPIANLPVFRNLTSNFTSASYRAAVAQIIERIRDGEFFQANIAQTLSAEAVDSVSPGALFRAISGESSASFGALLQYEAGAVISNSPERFFRVTGENNRLHIITDPIKGTRPRGRTPAEDKQYAEQLLADPKDRAENIMIADLMRNDLSRICRDGSVHEDFICKLVSYAAVHHMVSRISGDLRPGLSAVDALKALFPCGSITGAPKVQAMKAIGEVEKRGRGPYCGAIGYMDDRGGAEFSVAIRTAIVTHGGDGAEILIPVGGGVTIRSDPEAEYRETLVKAKTILSALSLDGDIAE